MLKYVSMELVRRLDIEDKKADPEVTQGFFKGLKVVLDDTGKETTIYVVVEISEENSVSCIGDIMLLNLKHYFILSLERGDDTKRWISYPKASAADQKKVFEILAKVLVELSDNSMCTADPDIVDTSKYSNIPDRLLPHEKKLDSTAANNVINKSTNQQPNNNSSTYNQDYYKRSNNYTQNYNNFNQYGAKAPATPLFFKRTKTQPSTDELKVMLNKVLSVLDDGANQELPDIPGENKELPASIFIQNATVNSWSYTGYGDLYD